MRSPYAIIKASRRRRKAVDPSNPEESTNSPKYTDMRNYRMDYEPRRREVEPPEPHNIHNIMGEVIDTEGMESYRDPTYDCEPNSIVESVKREQVARVPATKPPPTKSFLPIAMPRPDPPEEIDAELEYRSIFEAPEEIEMPNTDHSDDDADDAITEVSDLSHVSELTGLNTLGTFQQRRVTDLISQVKRLQPVQTQPKSVTKHRHFQKRFGQISPKSSPRSQLARVSENSNYEFYEEKRSDAKDCLELEHKLKGISQTCNKRQSSQPRSPPGASNRRGLPYEATDFVADDETVDTMWDHITPTGEQQADNCFKRDPGEGQGCDGQIQGPPTPRSRQEENIFARLRETLSAEGDVIIDTTDINDEDVDLHAQLSAKSSSSPSQLRYSKSESQMGSQMGSTMPDLIPPKQAKASDSAFMSLNEESTLLGEAIPHLAESRDDHGSSPPTPNLFSYPLAYFQSVAKDLEAQLQNLQQMTYISDEEIDAMLGVLKTEIKKTSEKTPSRRDDIVRFIGEELEKTTCGLDRSIGEENDCKLTDEQVEALKTRFRHGLQHFSQGKPVARLKGAFQCGVNGPNEKAMEAKGCLPRHTFNVNVNPGRDDPPTGMVHPPAEAVAE